jgi:hypothetical protein
MEFLADLWLPVVLAAVAVFLASSVMHMALPWHKSDYRQLPNESAVIAALRSHGVGPGQYMFPRPTSMKECSSPEMIEKFRQGPVGNMIVLPNGMPSMGKALFQWFVFCLFIGVIAAYVAWHALPAGAPYLSVFRIAGTTAFMAYGVSSVTDSIWKGLSWGTTTKFLIDGIVYALVTGGVFGWQWPGAGA